MKVPIERVWARGWGRKQRLLHLFPKYLSIYDADNRETGEYSVCKGAKVYNEGLDTRNAPKCNKCLRMGGFI